MLISFREGRMKTRMKNSNIEWIGQIPDDWIVKKVKHCFYISKEKAYDKNPTVLSLARAGVKVRDISNNAGQMAASYEEYNPVIPGDLLLNPMDLYSGANCNVSEVSGVISPAYTNLRALTKLEPKYFDYYFKVQYWAMAMFAHGKGISFDNRWTMNSDAILNYYIPYPSVEKQKRIVEFLNKKCSEIDQLIEIENQQIEKLKEYKQSVITEAVTKGLDKNAKMKDSGVANLGEIRNDYRIVAIKFICPIVTDYVASGSFADLAKNVIYLDYPDYAMLVRTIDVSNKGYRSERVYINEHSYNFLKNSNLFGGEIILPNIGASVGDVYIVPKLYERMSLAPNSIMIKTNQIDKYYYYYFLSKYGRYSIINLSQSAAQPKFNKTDFKELKVIYPTKEEQNNIVNYLDRKCSEIGSLIDIKNKKIEELQEYKKSIIYEYVTGKKEVQ